MPAGCRSPSTLGLGTSGSRSGTTSRRSSPARRGCEQAALTTPTRETQNASPEQRRGSSAPEQATADHADPGARETASLLRLQRSAGNSAVGAMLQREASEERPKQETVAPAVPAAKALRAPVAPVRRPTAPAPKAAPAARVEAVRAPPRRAAGVVGTLARQLGSVVGPRNRGSNGAAAFDSVMRWSAEARQAAPVQRATLLEEKQAAGGSGEGESGATPGAPGGAGGRAAPFLGDLGGSLAGAAGGIAGGPAGAAADAAGGAAAGAGKLLGGGLKGGAAGGAGGAAGGGGAQEGAAGAAGAAAGGGGLQEGAAGAASGAAAGGGGAAGAAGGAAGGAG